MNGRPTGLRSKLMLSLLLFSTVPLVCVGWFVAAQVNTARRETIAQIQVAAQDTVEEMHSLSRRAARDEAEKIAAELSDFLQDHPDAGLRDLARLPVVRQAAESRTVLDTAAAIDLIHRGRRVDLAGLVEGDGAAVAPVQAGADGRRGYTYVAEVDGCPVKVGVRIDEAGIKKPVDELARIMRSIAELTENSANQTMDKLKVMLAVTIAAVVIALTVIAGRIASSVTQPIAKLTDAAERISRGELEVDLDVDGSREVRLLARAFDRAMSELRSYAKSLEAKNLELDVARRMATRASNELQKALDETLRMQKMSSLGRLVADMADDTDLGTGALESVTPEAAESLGALVDGLRRVSQMNAEDFSTFRRYLDMAAGRQFVPGETTSLRAQAFRTDLAEAGLRHPRKYAELLARCQVASAHDGLELCSVLDQYDVGDVFSALVEIHASGQLNRNSADRIAQVAQALKFYSQGGNAGEAVADVNQTLRDALVIVHNRLASRADIRVDLAEGLPNVRCSSGAVTEIWTQLLRNSCDAIEKRGPKFRGVIRLCTVDGGGAVHIIIRDNGSPLSGRLLSGALGPEPPAESGPWNGGGLAEAVKLVERSGGDLNVGVSDEDGFRTFEVILPAQPAPVLAAAS